MQTTLRSAFITDLLLPPPNSLPTLPPSTIAQLGYDVALSLLLDSEAFIRSNPLVTSVRPLHQPSDSPKHYIDVPHFTAEFHIDPAGDPARGIAAEWHQFEITDKLNWGLGSTDIIYSTAMRRIPGGFESVTNPGSGVRIYGRFEVLRASELGRLTSNSGANDPPLEQGAVRSSQPSTLDVPPTSAPADEQEGVIHFIEHNETRCNALLGVYIKATNTKSHREMHENFKRRWGEEFKRRLEGEVGKRPVVLGESRQGSAKGAGERKKVVDDGGREGRDAVGAGVGVGSGAGAGVGGRTVGKTEGRTGGLVR